MYIHKGLYEEAKAMLQENIKGSGATSYELANLGLCLGLTGDFEKAEKHFEAAEFYTSSGASITALVAFNRGIVAYKSGAVDKSKAFFQQALHHS